MSIRNYFKIKYQCNTTTINAFHLIRKENVIVKSIHSSLHSEYKNKIVKLIHSLFHSVYKTFIIQRLLFTLK